MTIPKPKELRDMLAQILEGAAGATAADWSRAIGDVHKLPTWLTCGRPGQRNRQVTSM